MRSNPLFLLAAMLAAVLVVVGCDRKAPEPSSAPSAQAPAPAPPPPLGRVIRADGVEIQVDGRDPIVFDVYEQLRSSDSVTTATRKSVASGTGLTTTSDRAAQEFQSEAPSVSPEGASGGGFAYKGDLFGGAGLNAFHMLGIACFVGGLGFVAVPLFFRMPARLGTAGALFAGGVCFVAIGESIEQMPYAWAVGGLVLVAVLGWWLWNAVKSGKTVQDLRATVESTVAAVSSLSPAAKQEFKRKHSQVSSLIAPDKVGAIEKTIADAKSKRRVVMVDHDGDPSTPPVPFAARPMSAESYARYAATSTTAAPPPVGP